VKAAHPNVAFEIVRTARGGSVNPKVAQLEVLERSARFGTIWISDSNTRVHPETLAAMAHDLARPGVGMVLSPVVGTGETTLGAALDNLHISSFVTLSTYAIEALQNRIVAPGKSTLLRRSSLTAIGGFAELGNYCAEDYVLVERLRARGERVVLGRHLVANVNVGGDVAKFYRRHFRWTQMHWLLEWGTALEPLLMPMLFALAWLVVAPSIRTLSVFAFVATLQTTVDLWVLSQLRGRAFSTRLFAAAAMRPLIFAWLWVRSPFARKVVWRGNVRWLGDETRLLESRPGRLAGLLR
jgi:ceramide glucosyltransferase